MREIKFRAWVRCGEWEEDGDKRKFEMVGADSFAFEEFAPISELLVYIPDQQYVMQYTGLKDKNGKEIYEGDVVKVREHLIGRFASNTIRIVEFSRGSFLLTANKVGDPMVMWLGLEVIGNIYENPELVKP